MNKYLFGLLAFCITQAAFAGNYILMVDGKSYEIDLGEQKAVQTTKGSINVSLEKKASATFAIDGIAFDHPSTMSPTVSILSDEVKQVLLAQANGDLFLIQLYKGMDGSSLIPLLEKEMTKEEVGNGYTKNGKDVEIKLDNGETLSGRFIQTDKNSDTYDRYIVGCPIASGGLVAVIQTSDLEAAGQDKAVMMKVMKSLKVNCKK
ncbi:MAG: hypothetical protein ABI644_04720 [Arenimonas sp.]